MSVERKETNEIDQDQAKRDLFSTYSNPIKAFYQSATKNLFSKFDSNSILRQREFGLIRFSRYPTAREKLADRLLPNRGEIVAKSLRSIFCGQFSQDGRIFLSAGQDNTIRIYEPSISKKFREISRIPAEEVGWSILDTALANDGTSLAYSTWSDSMFMIKLNEKFEKVSIRPLRLEPESHSFTIFSLQYSNDGTEIIGGSNDACVYVYDLEKQRRTLRVQAHRDDINAVRFVDNSNSLIVSGSDDGLVSVWDRRSLIEARPRPVGIFAGHTAGITFVHSRMDTRYLISNSKDQSIKLWDMRRFADEETIKRSFLVAQRIGHRWDYRFGNSIRQTIHRQSIVGDPSLLTYRGHSVDFTLIRCYFSPSFTTGQKYIISGSSDGSVRIYDVLTGEIRLKLCVSSIGNVGQDGCVRDISWHPTENYIVSTSWDQNRSHVRWNHSEDLSNDEENKRIAKVENDHRLENSSTFLERLIAIRHQFSSEDFEEDLIEQNDDDENEETDDEHFYHENNDD